MVSKLLENLPWMALLAITLPPLTFDVPCTRELRLMRAELGAEDAERVKTVGFKFLLTNWMVGSATFPVSSELDESPSLLISESSDEDSRLFSDSLDVWMLILKPSSSISLIWSTLIEVLLTSRLRVAFTVLHGELASWNEKVMLTISFRSE